MFQGPLPQDVIAALTAAFNLDDPVAEELDEAMARVAGDAIEDIQGEAVHPGAGEADNSQEEAVQAAAAQLPLQAAN